MSNEPATDAENVVAEPVPDGTEVTLENAGVVETADGVQHVGILPAEDDGDPVSDGPSGPNDGNV